METAVREKLLCGEEIGGLKVASIRTLTEDELDAAIGGFFPAALFAGALVGHTGLLSATGGTISMTTGVAAHIVSGIGLGAAAFSMATAYGRSSKRPGTLEVIRQ